MEGQPRRPAGLEKLTNTCYLNSVLQYLYSVQTIREHVLSVPLKSATQEDLQSLLSHRDNADLDLDLRRAFVGNEFLMELQELFSQLQNADSACVAPRQRLANAALLQPDRARPGSDSGIEELIAELDKDKAGSDQMHVDEVMGNAISLLCAGFKVSSLMQAHSSPDHIEAAFFSTFVDNRMKLGESAWKSTTRKDRWVTAYPAPRGVKHPISLHEALEASFDRQVVEGSVLAYTSIRAVASHFHIYIQRSDGGADKNTNSISIPETIYLDRYLSSESEGVDIFPDIYRLRKDSWNIRAKLTEMEQNSTFKFALHNGIEGTGLEGAAVGIFKRALEQHEMLSTRRASLFENLKSVKYRLHAVICHAGGTVEEGHYWIWIHDFECGVWRKYNDTTVTEHSQDEVSQALEGGEPYYLAYTRA